MPRAGRKLNLGVDRFSGLYLGALFIAIFGIWTPSTFLTISTLHSIASQQAIGGIVALAVLVAIAAGQYDLSVGANANLTGILVIVLQVNDHWAIVPAILFSVCVGIAIGVVNAVLVTRLHISSFIATLAMGSVLAAVLTIVSSSEQPQPVISTAWNNLTQTTVFGFQIVFLYLVLLCVALWWFLTHTPAGRYIYATGGNREAARLSGVRVDRWTSVALIISGGLSGLAGVLFASLIGPSLSFGPPLLLPAFAAVFLGSTQLTPGRFNVWGTFIAIYVLATGVQGLELVSGAQWLSDMFNGVALIVAVALAVNRAGSGGGRSRRWRRFLPGAGGQNGAAAVTDTDTDTEATAGAAGSTAPVLDA